MSILTKFLLPLALLTQPALASPWQDGLEACGSWTFPKNFTHFLEDGVRWQGQAEHSLAQVRKFSSQTCPHYVNRANASVSVGVKAEKVEDITLAQFIAAQQAMGLAADQAFIEATRLNTWIGTQLAVKEKTFRTIVGISIADSPCARTLGQTRAFITAKNRELEAAIQHISVECPGVAALLANQKRQPANKQKTAAPDASSVNEKNVDSLSGKHPPSKSGITGVDERRAMEIRLAD